MTKLSKGKIIIIVAPSGTGKSTIIKDVMKEIPDLQESVSCTTRKIREGEKDGEDYFFLPEEEFIQRKDNDDFLEWAKVHQNYYGTSKSLVSQKLDSGVDLLFDLDTQGVDSLKNCFGADANVIFIAPPSFEELERRLTSRGTESADSLKIRLNNAKNELKRKDDYDFCVINDDLEVATAEIVSLINKIIAEK
jgi:guanylate kinase